MRRGFPIARENFRRAGKEDKITLIEGDATEVLAEIGQEPYDFIFMDAAKGQYIHYLPDVLRLLAKGGCLVSDNVMQDGRYHRIPFCGGTQESYDPCEDARISV